jgi:outer membrane receptor protein involved in Fe transport
VVAAKQQAITGRGNYYGSVSGKGFTPGTKQTWGGKALFDLGVRYRISDSASVTVGGNNIFDTYPESGPQVPRIPTSIRSRRWASPTAGKRCRSA